MNSISSIQAESTAEKPFSEGYVLRTTTKNMRKAIDVSIRKTFDRIAQFDGNTEKSQEVFKTLSKLHMLKKTLDDFQLAHQEDFAGG
jgi:hypothetical protein